MQSFSPLSQNDFIAIYEYLKLFVDYHREILKNWNLEVSKLSKGQTFDVYYDWTHKRNLIHLGIKDFIVIGNVVYLNASKGISYDKSMVGISPGKIPGSPSTIKDLLNRANQEIPWFISNFPYLNPNNIQNNLIELGSLNNIPQIAYRLAIITILKLAYIPIGINPQGEPKKFVFNLPLIRILIDYKLKHYV